MRDQHKARFERWGRWILAVCVLAGWLLGRTWAVDAAVIGLLFAFLGGGVILNTIKEEVPSEHQSRFLPFLIGAAGDTILLMLM